MTATEVKFSAPSIIAIVAALLSFASGAFFGFFFALAALAFGALGLLVAFSPRRRGGIVSALAIVGGLLGLVAAIVKGIAWLF